MKDLTPEQNEELDKIFSQLDAKHKAYESSRRDLIGYICVVISAIIGYVYLRYLGFGSYSSILPCIFIISNALHGQYYIRKQNKSDIKELMKLTKIPRGKGE